MSMRKGGSLLGLPVRVTHMCLVFPVTMEVASLRITIVECDAPRLDVGDAGPDHEEVVVDGGVEYFTSIPATTRKYPISSSFL